MTNPKDKERWLRWARNNKEKVAIKSKKWKDKNREELLKKRRAYYYKTRKLKGKPQKDNNGG